MFSRLLLGLLRDGHARHGYELITSYRTRSGLRTNPGNFYRELAKLVAQGSIEQDVRPRDADPRRIPYRITDQGRYEFDTWMLDPISGDGGLEAWCSSPTCCPSRTASACWNGARRSSGC